MTCHPYSSLLMMYLVTNSGMVVTINDTTSPKTWGKAVIHYIKKSEKKVMGKWEIVNVFFMIWWPFFYEYKTFTYDGHNALFHRSWNKREVGAMMPRTEVKLVRTFDRWKLTKTLTCVFERKKDLSPYDFSIPRITVTPTWQYPLALSTFQT